MIRRLWRRKPSFLLSCLAKRRLFCGFQKLKPVGFCVLCEICGNYKQRRYKHKSISPINCNLHFCHSIFRMNLNWHPIEA